MAETEDYDKSATPLAHKTSHENGGSDVISVAWSDVIKSGSNLTDIVTRSHASLSNIGTLPHETIDSWLDQSLKQNSAPTFISLTILNNDINGNIILIKNISASGTFPQGAYSQLGPSGYGITDWPNAFLIEGDAEGGLVLGALNNDIKFQVGRITKMILKLTNGYLGVGKSPMEPLDVAGKIRTDVTLNTGLKVVGHYFTMNVNGTDVNVLCE